VVLLLRLKVGELKKGLRRLLAFNHTQCESDRRPGLRLEIFAMRTMNLPEVSLAVAEAHAKCIELYSERLMANEVRHMYFA
jgi:hypothetical protein